MPKLALKQTSPGHYIINVNETHFQPNTHYRLPDNIQLSQLTIPDAIPANSFLIMNFTGNIEIKGNIPAYSTTTAQGIVTVKGNVNSRAKISSERSIVIQGDVSLGACLTAKSDISISGNVAQATLRADGSIDIEGMVAAKTNEKSTNGTLKTYMAIINAKTIQIQHAEGTQGHDYQCHGEKITIIDTSSAAKITGNKRQNDQEEEQTSKKTRVSEPSLKSDGVSTRGAEEDIGMNQLPESDVQLEPFTSPASHTKEFTASIKSLHDLLSQPTTSAHLYPHQKRALTQQVNAWMKGQKDAIYPIATGGGKSVIIAHIVNSITQPRKKTLIGVSRTALIKQIEKEIKKYAPHLVVGDTSKISKTDVVITTYQELKLKHNDFKEKGTKVLSNEGKWVGFFNQFDNFIADEAHNLCGPSGVSLIGHLKDVCSKNQGAVFAFTATPEYNLKRAKHSGNKEDQVVNSVFHLLNLSSEKNPITPFPLKEAIINKALSPVKCAILTPELDLLTKKLLRQKAGGMNSGTDIIESEISRAIDKPELNKWILDTAYANAADPDTQERLLGKQAVVFCAGVNHAENMADVCNASIPFTHPLVAKAREQYVETMRKKHHLEKLPFNEDAIRAQFTVAKAIHAGKYSTQVLCKDIANVLEQPYLEYRRNGEILHYELTAKDREKLQKALDAGKDCKIDVSKLLNEKEREAILEDYKLGRYLVLCGADMLTEGFDHPGAKVLINARPTKSKVMAIQRGGRPLRRLINPDGSFATAYIFDVSWSVIDQLLFPSFLDGKMRLGQTTDTKINISYPEVTIANKATGTVSWEPNASVQISLTGSKRKAKSIHPDGVKASKTNPVELDTVIEKLQQGLDSIQPMLNELAEGINGKIDIRKAKPTAIPAPSETKSKTDDDSPEEVTNAEKTDFVDTQQVFTRGTKAKIQALQAYTDTVNQRLEDIINTVIEACNDSDDEETNAPKKKGSGNKRSKSEDAEPTNPNKKARTLQDPSQSLKKRLTHLMNLQGKLHRMMKGIQHSTLSGISGAVDNDPDHQDHDTSGIEEIVALCTQTVEELELFKQHTKIPEIITQFQTIRQDKQTKKERSLPINPVETKAAEPAPLPMPVEEIHQPQVTDNNQLQEEHKGAIISYVGYPLQPSLILYALQGQAEKCALLINQGENKDGVDAKGRTALHHAISENHYQTFQLLVEKGVNVNIQDKSGHTALHIASAQGNMKMCQLLLQNNANPYLKTMVGDDCLSIACRLSTQHDHQAFKNELTKIVFARKPEAAPPEPIADLDLVFDELMNDDDVLANISIPMEDPLTSNSSMNKAQHPHPAFTPEKPSEPTPSLSAKELAKIRKAFVKITVAKAKEYMDTYPNLASQDYLLHICAAQGNLWVCNELIDRGAKLNASISSQIIANHALEEFNCVPGTALHSAVKNAHPSVCRLLIKEGADVNAIDENRLTPLHLAPMVKGLQQDMVAILLSLKANVNAQSVIKRTPLHYAVLEKDIKTCRVLLQHGADPNLVDINNQTPLGFYTAGPGMDKQRFIDEYRAAVKETHSKRQGKGNKTEARFFQPIQSTAPMPSQAEIQSASSTPNYWINVGGRFHFK